MKSPLYITGVHPDGKIMFGGFFKLQDTHGLPIEIAKMTADEKGYLVDWFEALCDCWLNDCMKFNAFVRECSTLAKTNLEIMFAKTGADTLARFPKMENCQNPVDIVCRYWLAKKRTGSRVLGA